MNKKSWLDYLFYQIGNQQYDFYLQYSKKDKINTKWKKYSEVIFPVDFDGTCEDKKIQWFFENVNHRQILPNEIVLDLEEKELLNPAIEKLKEWSWDFSAFATGSRGYHIHIFMKRELTEREKLNIIKQFNADTQKASGKCLISLEYAPHWKSNKIKDLVNGN